MNEAALKELLDKFPCRETKEIWTSPARLFWPSLAKPWTPENVGSIVPRFVAVLEFPRDADLDAMRQAEDQLAGGDKGLRSPWKLKENGRPSLPIKSTQPPTLTSSTGDPLGADHFYAGCWVRGLVKPFRYGFPGPAGIAFMMVGLQKLANDEEIVM